MCLQTDKSLQREKLVEIMRQRHLWTEDLTTCLDVSGWSQEQRRLFLAEAFLQSRSKFIFGIYL